MIIFTIDAKKLIDAVRLMNSKTINLIIDTEQQPHNNKISITNYNRTDFYNIPHY